jgi:hypothetical protein
LLAEIDELRAEVARLHDLLGLAGRTGDEHQRSWAPTLFGGTSPTGRGDSVLPTGGRSSSLIRSLFGARSDVYAQRWENQNERQVRAGHRRRRIAGRTRRPQGRRTTLPLTDEVFASHLRGERRRSGSTRSCEATPARCWRATSTRAPGRSTRSPISTRATPAGCPRGVGAVALGQRWLTCGSSSTGPVSGDGGPRHGMRRCCAKR